MTDVPTLAELAKRRLAIPLDKTGVSFRVTDEGHRLMGEAMSLNAKAARERGDGDWVQPPSNGRPLGEYAQ